MEKKVVFFTFFFLLSYKAIESTVAAKKLKKLKITTEVYKY